MSVAKKENLVKSVANIVNKSEKNRKDSMQSIDTDKTEDPEIETKRTKQPKKPNNTRTKTIKRLGLTEKAQKRSKTMSLKVSEATYRELKEASQEMGIPVNSILNALIDDFLDSIEY